ncbi:MAG: hypothetical protein ABSA93_26030 [Streptosporangiaceae bacterium]|jgi:hypothetical protein
MPFQPPPRLTAAAASVLAAGLILTAASCSHVTPLGPDPAAAVPQPHHLRSPLVLQDMRSQPPAPAGGCPAGYVTLPGGASPGMCYRKTGTPVTITSAGVSPVSSFRPPAPSGQQTVPIQYGFWITLPAADVPALSAVIPTASGSPSSPIASVVTSAATIPAVSVAGRTWVLIGFTTRFTDRELEVFLPSRNQALQLQGMLAASG